MGLRAFHYFLLLIFDAINLGWAAFVVKSFKDCDPAFDYPVKMDAKFKEIDKKYFMDFDATFPVPLDNFMQLNFAVDAIIDENKIPVRILSGVEKNMCETLHSYLGEVMFEIERKLQLKPGVCPIPKGTYRFHNFALNLDRLPIQDLPITNLRAVAQATNIKDNSTLFCKLVKWHM